VSLDSPSDDASPLARVRSALTVSRNPVLRRFWLSQVVSECGDWIGLLGVAALLYQRTGQAVWAASAISMLYLPYLLSPVLAGLATRLPPRTLLVWADLLRSVLIGMLLLPGLPNGALLALVFAAAIPTSVYEATASAAVPEYAPDDAVRDDALVLFQSTQQAANMLGFLVGGALIAAVGVEAAIAANAVSYLVSALLLRGLPPIESLAADDETGFGLALAGLRALVRRPTLRRTVVLVVVSASSIMAGEALVVVYASEVGHPGWAGLLAGATAGVATVLGLLLPRHRDSDSLLRLSAAVMVAGSVVAIVSFSLWPSGPTGLVGYVALGVVSSPLALTYVVAVRQMTSSIRAPVFALVQVMLMGGQAAVAFLAGGLADTVGVGVAIALVQVPTLVVAGVSAAWTSRVRPVPAGRRPALDSP
jgi:MFS family permease